jgi:hypothetical protein
MPNYKFSGTSVLLILLFLSYSFIIQSCSGSKRIQSTPVTKQITIDASLSDWSSESVQRSISEDFDVSVANDDEFVYIAVVFRNNRVQQMARDFGFRIFLEEDRSFRRSFGIVYPVGMVHAISDFPGARRAYLENPGWRELPENRHIVASAESNMHQNVRIISRTERSGSLRPIRVSKEQLKANDIDMALDFDSRRMVVELKFPIHSTGGRQFGLDDNKNKRFRLGFEIEPPDYEEVTGERPTYERVMDASNQGYDPSQRGRSRTELQVSNPRLYSLLNYNYQTWVVVNLNY